MKFKTEKDSIDYFVTFLSNKGFTNINSTQSTDHFSFYDISSTYNGNNYLFEIKRRSMNSTEHGDVMVEDSKTEKMIEKMKNKEIRMGYMVNFFYDCFYVERADGKHKSENILCPPTTESNYGRGKGKVWKLCSLYPQTNKYNYENYA